MNDTKTAPVASAQPNLKEIDPGRERAESVAKDLRAAVDHAISEHGNEIAGYAVVVWDMTGRCTTGKFTRYGLVSSGLMPTLVHDALQRHVIIDMVDDGISSTTPPDTPA